MTETIINGVVIETNMAVTIRNGVVEVGTDPDIEKYYNSRANDLQAMLVGPSLGMQTSYEKYLNQYGFHNIYGAKKP